ncbi:hypothetical protein LY71_12140 [Geodermatophilus tzadiensis]|uniref:Uncharacterized protein n=1 Tax=Geodermatophilus tzadiensis TaxID=1137988 RepID=A0A2T0T142_9ACTN|nr:hypothetical protein LY71_12140 [Geodermatophilus tzadiensis]
MLGECVQVVATGIVGEDGRIPSRCLTALFPTGCLTDYRTMGLAADHVSPGRLTTIASWLLRAMTTTASSSVGFSSRCGVCGGTKM